MIPAKISISSVLKNDSNLSAREFRVEKYHFWPILSSHVILSNVLVLEFSPDRVNPKLLWLKNGFFSKFTKNGRQIAIKHLINQNLTRWKFCHLKSHQNFRKFKCHFEQFYVSKTSKRTKSAHFLPIHLIKTLIKWHFPTL